MRLDVPTFRMTEFELFIMMAFLDTVHWHFLYAHSEKADVGPQTWDGNYFLDGVLTSHVIPFVWNKENILSIKETTFLYDRASCMSALATHNYLKVNKADFFRNDEEPQASTNLNACV
ncbi:hypothetical protein Pcinc_009356 [Petrolisthes cinctipes]|uniref:Uncharacterized protein n=1 Tax=Petrolisthes cinctipes TaxID=88211 RepID=A0AAE1G7J1_PETCI|nr:hypothetical protein Pcinc_009356 [Petrolisthes cinctipes]